MRGLSVYDDDGGEIFNSETSTILSIGEKTVLGTHEDQQITIIDPAYEQDISAGEVDIVTALIGESPPFAEIRKYSRSFFYYYDGEYKTIGYVIVYLDAMDQKYRDLFANADNGECIVVAVVE